MKKIVFKYFIFALVLVLSCCSFFILKNNNSYVNAVSTINQNNDSINKNTLMHSTDSLKKQTLTSDVIYNFYSNYGNGSATAPAETKYSLLDDYMIYTQNQDAEGLCWDFAGSMVLVTSILKHTNQYVDLSEGWISSALNYSTGAGKNNFTEEQKSIIDLVSDNSEYALGDGGYFCYFDLIAENFGIVLESDYLYEDFVHDCNQQNTKYWDFYSQYANLSIMKNYQAGYYAKNNIPSIKNQIINDGGLYLGTVWSYTDIEKGSNSSYYKKPDITKNVGSHAVTIVGWDDNYQGIDSLGKTHTGAWLCLNSWDNDWGDNGLFYVFYDDGDYDELLFGYKYVDEKDDATNIINYLSESEPFFESVLKSSNSTYNSGYKQKNIFNESNIISLNYNYTLTESSEIKGVKVVFDGADITNKFSVNYSGGTLSVIANNTMEIGTYKVEITCEKNGAYKEFVNCFYVMDGLELSRIDFTNAKYNQTRGIYNISNDEIVNGKAITNNGKTGFYNSYNKNGNQIYFSTSIRTRTLSQNCYALYINFAPATYTEIRNISINFSGTKLSTATGFLLFYSIPASNTVTYTITLTSTSGNTRQYDLTIYYIEDASSTTLVNVDYDTNKGVNSPTNCEKYLLSPTQNASIQAPTKTGYTFGGWYYDYELTNALTKSGNDYLINFSNILYNASPTVGSVVQTDYYNLFVGTAARVFAYAKWERVADLNPVTNFVFENGNFSWDLTSGATEYLISCYKYDINTKMYTEISNAINIEFINNYSIDLQAYIKQTYGKYKIQIIATNKAQGFYSEPVSVEVNVYYLYLTETETKIVTMYLYENEIITQPDDPVQLCYEFKGWYTTSLKTDLYVFGKAIKNNTVIYAKWERVADLNPVTNFVFENGKFSWDTSIGATKYSITCYKFDELMKIYSKMNSATDLEFVNNSQIDLQAYIKQAKGKYKIEIIAKNNDTESFSDPVSIEVFVYKITFNKSSIDKSEILLYQNETITQPSYPSRLGYSFTGWYSDSNSTALFSFGNGITSDTSIYAKWSLVPITINNQSTSINSTYDKQQKTLSVNASHSSGLTSFSYQWYSKNGISGVALNGKTGSSLELINATDSGTYYCEITLRDPDGVSTSIVSNNMNVSIARAESEIDVTGVKTQYTYNGKQQIVNSGAVLNHTEKTIHYSYNSFTTVAEGNGLVVEISVPQSANYEAKTEHVTITVNKASSSIVAASSQAFVYNGTAQLPVYTVTNNELQVHSNIYPIFAGSYNVVLSTNEGDNYYASEKVVSVVIRKAQIKIEADNKSSIFLFGLSNLTYNVSGDYVEGDELNVSLSTEATSLKPGKFDITLSANNSNYDITIVGAKYSIIITPYIIFASIIILLIIVYIMIKSNQVFEIDFNTNGAMFMPAIEEKKKKDISIKTPIKKGFVFDGWFYDDKLTMPFDNQFKRGKQINLYAKWKHEEPKVLPKEQKEKVDIEEILQLIRRKKNKETETLQNQEANQDEKIKSSQNIETDAEVLKEEPQELLSKEKFEEILRKIQNRNKN